LVTPFVAEEDTVMRKYMRSKRLGKSGLKAEKELIFGRDFCVSRPQRPHVGEFLKAWTVQAESRSYMATLSYRKNNVVL
jgi:hypothetical protein